MKQKTLYKVLLIACLMLVSSALAAAQECQGTLSGPTKQLVVGELFNITFFNAEPASAGDTLTLGLPSGLSTLDTNPIVGVAPFSAYVWEVNSTVTGSYLVNVTLNTTGCVKYFGPKNVTNSIPDPNLTVNVQNLGVLLVNSPINLDYSIVNIGPGGAYNVTGTLSTSAGATIVPNVINESLIGTGAGNNTVNLSATLTPVSCGIGDVLTVAVNNHVDEGGEVMLPVSSTDVFDVIGSDVAVTSYSASVNPVIEGAVTQFSVGLNNIGNMTANNVQVGFYDNATLLATVVVGNMVAGNTTTVNFDYAVAQTGGNHTLTAQMTADNECVSGNNQATLLLQVTGATCSDGVQNQGEAGVDCGSPCAACPSPISGGGGGGGGGGGSGNIYVLTFDQGQNTKSMRLKTGDTVRYVFGGQTNSMHFKRIYATDVSMGLSQTSKFRQFKVNTSSVQSLDLDADGDDDLTFSPTKSTSGATTIVFTRLGVSAYKVPTFVLPTKPKKTTTSSTESSVPVKAAETVKKAAENVANGVLDFVESFDVRRNTPLWGGLAVAAVIVLLGLGLYYVVMKEE